MTGADNRENSETIKCNNGGDSGRVQQVPPEDDKLIELLLKIFRLQQSLYGNYHGFH